ncbi:MAG: hypothetical protein JO079_12085, partial [Frankiaceae bacterium]|nr:hypothetical protein [Frankiaceae bacterium]MBV9368435.1 hypothetical protein [Frankiales bacterium]
RHDLPSRWLNDSAAAYWPQTLDEADCDVLLDHAALLVLGTPYRAVFLMKLLAARAADYEDLVRLWLRCGFTSATEAADEMYDAFPAAASDPYLAEFVQRIADEAETRP